MKAKKTIKKVLIMLACIVALTAVIYAAVWTLGKHVKAEVYTGGGQTVTLFEDGSFTADLHLNKRLAGTYVKHDFGYVIAVQFFVGGQLENGFLKDDVLQLPSAWEIDDNESFLPRR
jgi:hypothetical protein